MSELTRILEPEAFAYETITVTSATVGFSDAYLTSSRGRQIKKVYVQNASGNITFRVDGVAASSTSGYVLRQYETTTIIGEQDIRNFSTRSVTSATNGEIRVTYFR